MPVNEVAAKVNRELKSLRPLVEERLLFLQKSDRLLQVLYETACETADDESGLPRARRVLLEIDREIQTLEMNISLAVSRVLGFAVVSDQKILETTRGIVKSEHKKTHNFLQERIAVLLPVYSSVRYGLAKEYKDNKRGFPQNTSAE